MTLGMCFGIAIGVLTGIIVLIILAINNHNIKTGRETGQLLKDPRIIMLLFSIPGCWALGFVGNGVILKFINIEEIITTYLTYLLSTFGAIIIAPLVMLIIKVTMDLRN